VCGIIAPRDRYCPSGSAWTIPETPLAIADEAIQERHSAILPAAQQMLFSLSTCCLEGQMSPSTHVAK
jgi:hypothetical protein